MVTVEEKVNCVLQLAELKSVTASKSAEYSKRKTTWTCLQDSGSCSVAGRRLPHVIEFVNRWDKKLSIPKSFLKS